MAKFNSKILAGAAIAAALFSQSAYAADVSGDASARIIQPLSITKDADMNFGEILPSDAAGSVTLSTAGSVTASGGATIFDGSNAQAASFDVRGEGNEAYSLTLPTTITLTDDLDNTMTVSNFQSSATEVLNLNGREQFDVGASLSVGANQSAGLYAGSFTVSVDYP